MRFKSNTVTQPRTKLAWIRHLRGLSQTQLAAKSGVTADAIRHYEQRHRRIDAATGETLWKLATALEVSIEALLEHDHES